MLLDQVLSELSEKGLGNFEKENPPSPSFGSTEDSIGTDESSDRENSSLINSTLIGNEINCRGCEEKELKLPLESNAMLCNSVQSQKLDSPSGSVAVIASIPFHWEEKPGKPKNPSVENPEYTLRLPPIRQSKLYPHVGDQKSSRKTLNSLSGRYKFPMQGRASKPINQVAKVPTGMEIYKRELAKDFAASDLESIWEEEDEEELLELCKTTYSSQDFQEIYSRRSYDLMFPETIEEYMVGIGGFADDRSSRYPMDRRHMMTRSAELAPRRFHSPWMGFKSTELGLHTSDKKSHKMTKTACTVPVEDCAFSNFKVQEENDMPVTIKQDFLENDGSWSSLVQKSLSGQRSSSRKYHQELMRSHSVQASSPLYSLKRVSSIVKKSVWNSQGSLSSEDKVLDIFNSKKVRKIQNPNLKKDEEYTDEEEDDDDDEEEDDDDDSHTGFTDHISSKELNVATVGQESGYDKSSNCSCKVLVPLSLPDYNPGKEFLPTGSPKSRSRKEVIPFGRFKNCVNNISVTPVKDDSPINAQRHYKNGIENKASVEYVKAVKYKGSCGKHSKSANPAKMQFFSVLLRNFMVTCGFASTIRHDNKSGFCRKSGTQTIQCIRKKKNSQPTKALPWLQSSGMEKR
ncbi:hypothetical protein SUGI_0977290 [Cryptomeria japonica]|nr:hypothetical protein SUGI_0977290 [Cryptomeria japonica]